MVGLAIKSDPVVAPPPSVSVTSVSMATNVVSKVRMIVLEPEPAALATGSKTPAEKPSAKRTQCVSIRATAMVPVKRRARNSPSEAARRRRDPAVPVAWRRCTRWHIAALHTATDLQ